MGFSVRKSIAVILIASIGYQIYKISLPPTMPHINLIYKNGRSDTKIEPFKINVPTQVLEDLNRRLDATRELTPPLKDAAFTYGFNTNKLKSVIDFWRNKYNWRQREKYLNSLPQFKTNIGSVEVHFIHVKPAQTKMKTLPLILLHGWPGSVREFYELIPLLTTPQKDRDFVFEVIAPSLPGYGFSGKPTEKGYNSVIFAAMMNDLMVKLGFQKYYVQGGDWGSAIGANMAILYPDRVLGLHSNLCFVNSPLEKLKKMVASVYPSLFIEEKFISRVYPAKEHFFEMMLESGYFHLQATKPDTIGVALTDSPAGLAAYILEKFSTWTNKKYRDFPDGKLEEKFTLTNLLDNVMIYWVTGTITSSMRLYSESFALTSTSHDLDRQPVAVPTICARFPHELFFQPEFILKEKFVNLTRVTDPPRGGHFAAFEEPQLMAEELFAGFGEIQSKYYSK
uniref:Epoxide hydrolase n=1 Tax=Laodelphax striatellus TaxID=195883 RepID=A0A5J6D240_LAOST|nr:juvenile hormone epoxide hydrolase 2-like protein [Laodelphax striatellus]